MSHASISSDVKVAVSRDSRVCSYGYELETADEVTIDPGGDLHLRVGEGFCIKRYASESSESSLEDPVHTHHRATEFLVDSKALSRASPVLSKMLYGDFVEAQKPDPCSGKRWLVSLPDDDIKVMSALLHIMHCRFDKLLRLTGSISLNYLYKVAVATDKYDCIHLVQPWIKYWLPVAADRASWASCQDLHVISWIAWEFGSQSVFETAFRKLVWNTTPNEVSFGDVLEPTGLQDMVATRRLETIERILRPVRSALEKLTRTRERRPGDYLCNRSTYLSEEKLDCEALMLGRLIQSLVACELWPIPETSSCPYSASKLLDAVRNLPQSRTPIKHLQSHADCFPIPKLKDTLNAIAEGTNTSLTTPEQTRRLSAQAKKSGLSF